jgi:hypothetical protein
MTREAVSMMKDSPPSFIDSRLSCLNTRLSHGIHALCFRPRSTARRVLQTLIDAVLVHLRPTIYSD